MMKQTKGSIDPTPEHKKAGSRFARRQTSITKHRSITKHMLQIEETAAIQPKAR